MNLMGTFIHNLLSNLIRCSFAEWQRLLECFPCYLNNEQGQQLRDLGLQCCHFYAAASWISNLQGRLRWLVIPKLHLLNHLASDSSIELYNPRFYHNYSGEDYMGYLKKIVFQTQGPGMAIRVLKRSMLKLQAARADQLRVRG